MTEFARIALADILVPDRLREVDEDQAAILSSQIAWQGQINPITVRRTPPATKPYRKFTLVAGAHRLRAVAMLQQAEIDAMIVKANGAEAVLLEITENLIRNELTILERSVFVMKYREAWEERFGKIKRGGDRTGQQSDKLSLCSPDAPTNVVDLLDAMEGSTFFERAAERLGVHPRTVKRLQSIGQRLTPELRRAVTGTTAADNQSQLLKLAGLEPERQRKVAAALGETRDVGSALDLTDPHARAKANVTPQQEFLSRLQATWPRADEKTKTAFLTWIGMAPPAAQELLAKAKKPGGAP